MKSVWGADVHYIDFWICVHGGVVGVDFWFGSVGRDAG